MDSAITLIIHKMFFKMKWRINNLLTLLNIFSQSDNRHDLYTFKLKKINIVLFNLYNLSFFQKRFLHLTC